MTDNKDMEQLKSLFENVFEGLHLASYDPETLKIVGYSPDIQTIVWQWITENFVPKSEVDKAVRTALKEYDDWIYDENPADETEGGSNVVEQFLKFREKKLKSLSEGKLIDSLPKVSDMELEPYEFDSEGKTK